MMPIGKIISSLGTKIVGGVSGPLGWVASLVIDRIIKFGWAKLQAWIEKMKKLSALKAKHKEDEKRADNHEDKLQNGVTEQSQIDASLDVLNSSDRSNLPK